MKRELMSTRRTRRVELTKGCAFGIGSCAKKKRLVCSKCDDQSFLKCAHHLPLGPVNVWWKYKNELWEQFR